MKEMTDQCCSGAVKPDFDMINQLMEHRGKSEFGDIALQMLKEFCGQERKIPSTFAEQYRQTRFFHGAP